MRLEVAMALLLAVHWAGVLVLPSLAMKTQGTKTHVTEMSLIIKAHKICIRIHVFARLAKLRKGVVKTELWADDFGTAEQVFGC